MSCPGEKTARGPKNGFICDPQYPRGKTRNFLAHET